MSFLEVQGGVSRRDSKEGGPPEHLFLTTFNTFCALITRICGVLGGGVLRRCFWRWWLVGGPPTSHTQDTPVPPPPDPTTRVKESGIAHFGCKVGNLALKWVIPLCAEGGGPPSIPIGAEHFLTKSSKYLTTGRGDGRSFYQK